MKKYKHPVLFRRYTTQNSAAGLQTAPRRVSDTPSGLSLTLADERERESTEPVGERATSFGRLAGDPFDALRIALKNLKGDQNAK